MQSPSRFASSASESFPASAVFSSSANTARPMRNFCSRELNRRTTSWPTQMLGGSLVSATISPLRAWYTSK